MSHRILNNVGYRKIYPMSTFEDSTFCHYCGRKASLELRLEWDHVPALNVKIPEGCEDIRKTLVRSCNECNGIASDVPHMDYLERHFWLKAAYLRRYKRFLVNYNGKTLDTDGVTGYLLAAMKNADIRYEEILNAIGFGIKHIEQIDSPILQVRVKSNRLLANIISEYLHGIPS